MPPLPVVASSSSSSQPWRPQNPSPACFPGDGSFFFDNSRLDYHLLTQALTHQLSSPPSDSPKSLAKTLSHCLSTRPSWQTRALQLPHLDLPACKHQQKSQCESSNLSHSMSTSDLKDALSQPGSPFTTSCANSNNSMGGASGDNKPRNDARALLFQHEIEDSKACQFGNSPLLASRAAPMSLSSLKLGDQRQAMANNSSTAALGAASLSAQASAGAGATKVGKRRSRAASKVPITILSADTTNFRAMVQKLTGIPTSPSSHGSKFQLWGAPEVPVVKPHPTRPPHSIQGLPTLDTSASLLVDGASTLTQNSGFLDNDNLLQSFPSFSFLQSPHPHSDSAFDANMIRAELGLQNRGRGDANMNSFSLRANSDLKSAVPNVLGGQKNLGSSLISPPSLWYSGEGNNKFTSFNNPGTTTRGAEQFSVASNVESMLMSNDRPDVDFAARSLNYVDSWFAFDGALANHAFNMEPARIS